MVRASGIKLLCALVLAHMGGAGASAQPAAQSAAASKSAPAKVLCLKQKSDMNSTFAVYVRPDAVLVDCPAEHYAVLSRAPDWRVYIWNYQRRQITSVSHADWCGKYEIQGTSWTVELKKPLKVTHYSEKGRNYNKYFYGTIATVGCFLKTDIGSGDNKAEINHSELVTMDYINGDKMGPVYGRLRGLPALSGLPVSAKRYRPKHTDVALEIVSMQEAAVDARTFELPKGFKAIPFGSEILCGNEHMENIRVLVDELAR